MSIDRGGARQPFSRWRQLLLVIGLAMLGLLAISFGRLALIGYELNLEGQALRDEIGQLKQEHQRLTEELAYWQSDEGLERLARERLGWVREGETKIIVVPTGSVKPASSPVPPPQKPTPNWLRWFRLFFGS